MAEILIIGASIIDILAQPAEPAVFEVGTYSTDGIRMSTGGDALNEALILGKMGASVELSTVIGRDDAGDFLCKRIRECGVLLNPSCVRDDIRTGINIVLVTPDGERHFLTDPHSSLRALKMEHIRMPFPEETKIVCFASMFVSPHLGVSEMEEIFRQVKAQRKTLCVDVKKRKTMGSVEELRPALQYVDYIFPNAEEALSLTHTEKIEDAAEVLLGAGVKHVIIKDGSRGCLVRTVDEDYMVPAVDGVNCLDTTGAGDSFAAGFLYALSKGKTLRECAEYGNACGAKAVQVVGATTWI